MALTFKVVRKVYQDSSQLEPSRDIDFYLEENDWDDFHYHTDYYLHSAGRLSDGKVKLLGLMHIMKIGQEEDAMYLLRKEFGNRTFHSLPSDFISMSFSYDFYRSLLELLRTPKEREEFLLSLNMILSKEDALYEKVKMDDCFNTSLMRNASMDAYVLKEAINLLTSGHAFYNLLSQSITFEFDDCSAPVKIQFDTRRNIPDDDVSKLLPSRIVAFIGKNGCGKSTILYRVARLLFADANIRARYDKVKSISPNDIGFSSLIMLSYSAFDNFTLPGINYADYQIIREGMEPGKNGRFHFLGLRDVAAEYEALIDSRREEQPDNDGDEINDVFVQEHCPTHKIKTPDSLAEEFSNAISNIDRYQKKRILWNSFIKHLMDSGERNAFDREGYAFLSKAIDADYSSFFAAQSTGWKFILHAIAGIISAIEPHSLLLFDEPENHIHPPLLSFFLKEIRILLDEYDSAMLIGTHSPVILQELYSENVIVVNRDGETKTISRPSIQTFGATFGAIQADVFFLNSDSSVFYSLIDNIIEANYKIKEPSGMIEKVQSALGIKLNSVTCSYIASKTLKDVEN